MRLVVKGVAAFGASLLLAVPALAVDSGQPDALSAGFMEPPNSAKPRVWWHWMNGNITKEGIKLDLDWMKRIGIGGVQNFDASLGEPQVVASRLTFMSPPWKDAFSYAVRLADDMGLEMAIAGSPGWSETGGPWVAPADGMKKVVWSETELQGGRPFKGSLAKPPSVSGPFLNKPRAELLGFGGAPPTLPEIYVDTAVIAYRMPPGSLNAQNPKVTASGGTPDLRTLTDGDPAKTVRIPIGKPGAPAYLQCEFARPQTIYGVTLAIEHVGPPLLFGGVATLAQLQSSNDGVQFQTVAEVPTERGGLAQDPGQSTLAFAPVTARFFRLTLGSKRPPTQPVDPAELGLPAVPPPTEFRVSEFKLHSAAMINHFEEKAAFALAPSLYGDATPSTTLSAVIDPKDIVDVTDRMRADGQLEWTPPPGRWSVLRLGYSLTGARNGPASPEATGLEVDKLNAAAVRGYLDQYLSKYQDASGGLMGARGVTYVVTDSWEAGAQNWTPELFAEFKRRRGYDLHAWMPVLAGHVVMSAEASDQVLWDFRQTLSDLVAENHYAQLAEVLHQRGMGLYSESHESGRAFIGDGMSVKRGATIPMGAMWTQVPGVNKEQYGYNADLRESASVAHIYGQNLVAAESMTAVGSAWAWAPEYLKPTADQEMAMGVNRFVIHTSVHQPLIGKAPGLGLGPFGQWFTRNETWAEKAGPWVQYLARASYLLQQGRFVADLAYFYGEDSNVTALFADKSPNVPAGYNFDFINAEALKNALTVEDGVLVTAGGMRYRALILDANARFMSLPVLRRLADLVRAGAIVIGEPPAATPSFADDRAEFDRLRTVLWGEAEGQQGVGRGHVYSGAAADRILRSLGIEPDFLVNKPQAGADVLFVHRHTDDAEIYYVDSRSDLPAQIEAGFRVTGRAPELWHADTGKRESVSYRSIEGRTLVPLTLNAHETVFVVFRQATPVASWTSPSLVETPLMALSNQWQLRFQADRGAPEANTMAMLGSWSDSPDAGIRYFSGTGIYSTTVSAPRSWFSPNARLWLDLGKVMNVAQVRVNGRDLGVIWKAPFRVDVTDALKPGTNEVQIEVTNLWVNRLIGDQQPNITHRYSFTTRAFYKADAPLLPSGLLGPVQMLKITHDQ